jgi:hypothetical protein
VFAIGAVSDKTRQSMAVNVPDWWAERMVSDRVPGVEEANTSWP